MYFVGERSGAGGLAGDEGWVSDDEVERLRRLGCGGVGTDGLERIDDAWRRDVHVGQARGETLGMDRAVTPRFRTQGSWSYQTCVQPAWHPPQEMDWDYGVYLPVTVWEDNGPPHKMAQMYFTLVEGLLEDLCRAKGWKLQPGKDTCIRVQINAWAHIDLPLYAAPETEFAQIIEKSASLSFAEARANVMDSADLGDMPAQQWEDLDHIVMATRKGEWKSSDPEVVSKWFKDRVLEHTDQLRRVCRYLKAWRDHHWTAGDGPTSVCIMVAVAQKFEPYRGRDDIALEKAARVLGAALKGEVRELGIDGGAEDFNKRMDADQRERAGAKADALAQQMLSARLKSSHLAAEAIDIVRAHLGSRVPHRVELVDPDSGADAVRVVGAQEVSRPVVRATTAG